jgi:hypothetical protein
MAEHLIKSKKRGKSARLRRVSCRKYKSADGYAEAMKEIVPRYLEKAEVDLAAQLADSIADPFVRDRLLSDVADKCAEIDDDDYAFQLVESIEDAGLQGEARERVAMRKAAAGEFEKASEIAAALDEPSARFRDYCLSLTAANRVGEARENARRIDYPAAKVSAFS